MYLSVKYLLYLQGKTLPKIFIIASRQKDSPTCPQNYFLKICFAREKKGGGGGGGCLENYHF